MNIRIMTLGATALFASAAIGAATTNRISAADLRARRQAAIARQGGEVLKPGSFAGLVAVVDETGRAGAECEKAASVCAQALRCNIRTAKDGTGANAVLTVIDDAKAPRILIAPEEHWGKVNLSGLMDDLPAQAAKDRFRPERTRRLIMRALAQVMGSGTSDYPGNLMSATKMRDLDALPDALPADVIQRCAKHLTAIGVTRKETSVYRKAVKEGWAPAPTNDVQRKIWDEVRAIPTKPLTIKP